MKEFLLENITRGDLLFLILGMLLMIMIILTIGRDLEESMYTSALQDKYFQLLVLKLLLLNIDDENTEADMNEKEEVLKERQSMLQWIKDQLDSADSEIDDYLNNNGGES